MGRPSDYTEEVADLICARLSTGESLYKICKDDDLPHESTVRKWALEDREGFYTKYARARDIGLDCKADHIEEEIENEPDTQRARLKFDHARWYLSKMAPKRYGDRSSIELSSDPERPVRIERVNAPPSPKGE